MNHLKAARVLLPSACEPTFKLNMTDTTPEVTVEEGVFDGAIGIDLG